MGVMLVRWMMVDVGVDKEADDVAKQGLCGNEAAYELSWVLIPANSDSRQALKTSDCNLT